MGRELVRGFLVLYECRDSTFPLFFLFTMCYLHLHRWRRAGFLMSLLCLLILGSADLMAQSQSVRIQVLDEHTGDPLVAAVAHIG